MLMFLYVIEFIDGKQTCVEAESEELRDSEWVFRRGDAVVAHYQEHQVRGFQKLPHEASGAQTGGAW